ncbi:DUF1217 domain-containing protein [Rubellimicrobium rubrum]|uniref:DUF1217 domain-containing protein n=1 Tax=Rubellimicrobium rubrum TaxID=2585369 RepID=A0A5C4N5D4_9RHOB|nr:DUF1217 domain-containing protein [Rubellimicrobium rubrum]TNC51558.1 DUF1217 domain-containing protein [Rubellimicrobium rubrum]
MTYQPVLPLGGYTGWRYLQRTLDTQQASFSKSAPVQRATEYFKANISKAKTAADLVGDRRLLEVALGAFGLSDDVNSKAFVQKILEGGTIKSTALANKLSDKRYAALAFEFGYGNLGARTGLSGFADKIIAKYQQQAFQEAVGDQNNDFRMALNLSEGIKDITGKTQNTNAQWYLVMGNAPLKQVFQKAMGLPASLSAINVDKQLTAFKDRAQSIFGTTKVSDFADPAKQEKLVRLFLLRSESQSSAASPASMALQLLGGAG